MARLYIIGDDDTGILFVKTDPLMLTHISKATIEAYAKSHGTTFDAVLSQIASGSKAIINKTASGETLPDLDSSYDAIGKLIGMGSVVSDARFCFVADIDATDWASSRFAIPPIKTALSHLDPPSSPEDFVQLRDAPLD